MKKPIDWEGASMRLLFLNVTFMLIFFSAIIIQTFFEDLRTTRQVHKCIHQTLEQEEWHKEINSPKI